MDASRKPLRSPGEEWFDLVVRAAVVWGLAFVIDAELNGLLREALPRGWRTGISAAVAFLFVGAVLWGGEMKPHLRDAFFAWRYAIAIMLAVYVGYQWHAHGYGRSQEARLNEAARWACAKNPSCQNAALDYLSDKDWDD